MTTKTTQPFVEMTLLVGTALSINGREYSVQNNGAILPTNAENNRLVNPKQAVLEVGQRLKDGTVVLSVDPDQNEALFIPAKIFGGKSSCEKQDEIVEFVNGKAWHGYRDWRRITDDEGKTLSKTWNKVATPSAAARPPSLWLASSYDSSNGRVLHIGNHNRNQSNDDKLNLHSVPVVRSGPAWNLEI